MLWVFFTSWIRYNDEQSHFEDHSIHIIFFHQRRRTTELRVPLMIHRKLNSDAHKENPFEKKIILSSSY